MHRLCLVAMGGMLMAVSAQGQLDLKLRLEHAAVLTHEPILAHVTIHNTGIQPVTLNAPDGTGVQLRFYIERDNGDSVATRRGAPRPGRVVVPVGGTQTVSADLTMLCAMQKTGRYFVRGLVSGGRADSRSRLQMVDVVPGLELTKVSGAVPGAPGVRRTFALRYWARERKEQLFLCVSDEPRGRIFAPVALGAVIRVVRPTLTMDHAGTVTVSHQINRAQMMISNVRSAATRLTLESQRTVRIQSLPKRKPATLPSK
ncbi:MAG: hypothetical protein HN919_04475 [Verrucomicrobia bacterium]|jgi:hypothetical protein|nr:hypothetical protein [Verrucomicrobiota bacterium]MBT7065534.1 hypothetical protein [Verrucomicrobiota bacterium]MBT7700748.1 hypothetical protein [Verrucomicrobiota bacterium]